MRLRLRQMDRPQCGSGGVREDYNLPLHVGALFIILTVSASACAFALVVTKVPALRINPRFLFAVRHFGTGVLLATAFVHLLPTAFISLTDPCLPGFWNDEYPAMAGAIALASVFAIATLEMVFSPGRHCGESVEHLTRSEEEHRASTQKERQSNALEVPGAPSKYLTALSREMMTDLQRCCKRTAVRAQTIRTIAEQRPAIFSDCRAGSRADRRHRVGRRKSRCTCRP